MKTKEFIKKVEALGYIAEKEDVTKSKSIFIVAPEDETQWRNDPTVANISTTWEAWGAIYHLDFSGRNDIELLRVMADYLETPLEEREDEKKYRVEIKTSGSVLHLWRATDGSGDTDFIDKDRITTGQRMFTIKEIESIDSRYLEFAVEVTE